MKKCDLNFMIVLENPYNLYISLKYNIININSSLIDKLKYYIK
jgi:hypothetical protein